MYLFEITGNIAFDYFYSLNLNIGLIIWSCLVILRLLRS